MIGLRKTLKHVNVEMNEFSIWIDQGIKNIGKDPENFNLPIGSIISEIELITTNFAKGPVTIEHLTKEALHALIIAVTSLQVLKLSAMGQTTDNENLIDPRRVIR